MSGFYRTGKKTAGLPPGTLYYGGEKRDDGVVVTLIDYSEETFTEKVIERIEDCFPFRDEPTVTWINIDGLYDMELVEKLGERFGIHPLILEDIVSAHQRPKMEEFDDFIYIVLNMLSYDTSRNLIVSEQVSLLVGSNYVISFQEIPGDVFDPVRERIRGKKGRIVRCGADFLAYSLIDVIVDNYFTIIEKTGDRVEIMDDIVLNNPSPQILREIQSTKRDVLFLRKSVWPLREVISGLERVESNLVNANTKVYLRDVYDHTIRVIDSVESLRDMIAGIVDIYISSISNRMNDVMKVLTIISTIFIPVTFIVGAYGMNFEFMPELRVRWAYPAVWGVIVLVMTGMVVYFRRKRWL